MQAHHRQLYATLLLLLAIGVVMILTTHGVEFATAQQGGSATSELAATITATPLPEKYRDLSMTNGIIIGGVILVLIIIIGTLNSLRRHPVH
jgi:hypothetical protein